MDIILVAFFLFVLVIGGVLIGIGLGYPPPKNPQV